MRKILFIILLIILLAGCSDSIVKDGEFVFTEDEFKETYEEVNDKNLPTNVTYYPNQISLEFGEEDDAIEFLDAISELLDSDEARRLSESIENDENNIPSSVDGDNFSITIDGSTVYEIWVSPYTE